MCKFCETSSSKNVMTCSISPSILYHISLIELDAVMISERKTRNQTTEVQNMQIRKYELFEDHCLISNREGLGTSPQLGDYQLLIHILSADQALQNPQVWCK